MTFAGELNQKTERIVFDVAEIPLPYNEILGRPVLAKFMAASDCAYNMLKMPGLMNIITVPSDKKDALTCADQLYREAVAAAAAKAPTPADGAAEQKKTGETPRTHSGKRTSLGCCTPLEEVWHPGSEKTGTPRIPTQRSRRSLLEYGTA